MTQTKQILALNISNNTDVFIQISFRKALGISFQTYGNPDQDWTVSFRQNVNSLKIYKEFERMGEAEVRELGPRFGLPSGIYESDTSALKTAVLKSVDPDYYDSLNRYLAYTVVLGGQYVIEVIAKGRPVWVDMSTL